MGALRSCGQRPNDFRFVLHLTFADKEIGHRRVLSKKGIFILQTVLSFIHFPYKRKFVISCVIYCYQCLRKYSLQPTKFRFIYKFSFRFWLNKLNYTLIHTDTITVKIQPTIFHYIKYYIYYFSGRTSVDNIM